MRVARGAGGAGAPPSVCHVPEARLSCVGCCLYEFAGREALLAAIRRNTEAYAVVPSEDEGALRRFRDRETPQDVVCGNCVETEPGVFGCPLHPARHGFGDLRRGHCMADFLCRTAGLFQREWDEETRAAFVAFAAGRGLDPSEYARLMVSDVLLEEFLRSGSGPPG